MSDGPSANDHASRNERNEDSYGVLETRNIDKIQLGNFECDTWYGNAAYFMPHHHRMLGIDFYNSATSKSKTKKLPRSSPTPDPTEINGFWLDKLYVCEFCFKYTSVKSDMERHRTCCSFNTFRPHIGTLVYRDDASSYFIRRVRGFEEPLFCQNLSLFSKLFLDDKSVYYNVDAFDFYILYGQPEPTNNDVIHVAKHTNNHYSKSIGNNSKINFMPMGFFSKEVLSWDNDNNLACICIFPPYQRRHLGSLLIEFSYELAKTTPGQSRSGPEFPLSPYGRATYLRYWSQKLAPLLISKYRSDDVFNLDDLADMTSFRKEDLLMALEYMEILKNNHKDKTITLLLGNLVHWCEKNHVDPYQERGILNTDCLLL